MSQRARSKPKRKRKVVSQTAYARIHVRFAATLQRVTQERDAFLLAHGKLIRAHRDRLAAIRAILDKWPMRDGRYINATDTAELMRLTDIGGTR